MDSAFPRTATVASAGHVARFAIAATALTVVLLLAAQSTAQTTSQGQTVGSTNITLMGTITSTVVLSVEGSTNQNGGASTTIIAPSGSFSSVVTYTVTRL